MAGGATVGSSRAYRLDPYSLPVRWAAREGSLSGAGFTIERDRAIVQRQRVAGPETSLTVPLSSYSGVAVRMQAIGDEGAIRVFVELLHRDDPSLTLPLIVGDEPEDVVADWEAWGRALKLPLLVIGQDGSVSAPLTSMGGVVTTPAKPRRRHSFFAGRRPRFLTRRKTGAGMPGERIAGREIIARN